MMCASCIVGDADATPNVGNADAFSSGGDSYVSHRSDEGEAKLESERSRGKGSSRSRSMGCVDMLAT